MSKSLPASKKVMENYLSELLTEDQPDVVFSTEKEKKLERLMQQVNVVEQKSPVENNQSSNDLSIRSYVDKTEITSKDINVSEKLSGKLTTAKAQGGIKLDTPKSYRENDFQAMFFEVGGLLVAVPLIELGGIHNTDKTTPLMGKPDWFSGVMVHRDEKINVVDTALWVMPEKCDQKLKNSLNYQYIIMLSDSNWGLSAEKLVDTVILKQDDVKWLDSPSKRPWLAGLVKDRMCALLDVESLIKLLTKGMGK